MGPKSIAVIGAGFSGTLLSLHLLRHCPASVRITLIERGGQFGRGHAYSTGNPSHLLNVPASRMSAFHDRPSDFVDWLLARPKAARLAGTPAPDSFVPRQVFGAYVRNLLKDELRRTTRHRLELVRGAVTGLDRSAAPLRLALERGREITADLAVLAIGNFPPEPMPVADRSFYGSERYRPDPWAADALSGLDPSASVLLIGTGLTTIDMVVSLLDQGHAGPIHALSRRGLLPRTHDGSAGGPAALHTAFPTRLTALVRFLRDEVRRAEPEGRTWQPVIDELRPFTGDVWQTMSTEDRERFLRHIRPWWDVHRHRMAKPVADRIRAARASGQLRIWTGRIQEFQDTQDGVSVSFRPRGHDARQVLQASRVINCAGPGTDYDRISDPLVRSLLREGSARPDPLRLGLDVTPNCALLLGNGSISRRVFAVGPVTKGAFWEMTAVPDIRRQCELLAQRLAALIGPDAEPAREPAGTLSYSI